MRKDIVNVLLILPQRAYKYPIYLFNITWSVIMVNYLASVKEKQYF